MSLVRLFSPLSCWHRAALMLACVAAGPGVRGADEVLTPFTADHSEHDFITGQHHLMQNVDISIPGLMHLQCDDFRGMIPANSAEATNAVMTATGQVRLHLTGKPKGTNAPIQILALSDQAVYTGTNEMFVLTGHPKVVTAYGTFTGSVIRYDVANSKGFVDGPEFTPNATLLTNLLEKTHSKLSPSPAPGK